MERGAGLCMSHRKEILTAAAGPAFSLFLSLVSLCVLCAEKRGVSAITLPMLAKETSLWGTLFWYNMGFFLFNLLPLRLLDGGKVLLNILSRFLEEAQAERVARMVSMAFLFLVFFCVMLLTLQHKTSVSVWVAALYLLFNS
jgi:Zn-dependent protease